MTLDLKDRLYTSSEVAEILGVSLRSVYRYLEEGKIDADIKTATGRHRFSKKNILDFLQPGGLTKENSLESATESFKHEDDEEFDVLDLPAISKSRKIDENSDDFTFDLDEDFFKSLDFDSTNSLPETKNENISTNTKGSKVQNGEFLDDDLERLLREFEEKEAETLDFNNKVSSKSEDNSTLDLRAQGFEDSKTSSQSEEDDFDFDLDNFFKDLEDTNESQKTLEKDKNSKNVDFDFDFDFDFLNDISKEEQVQKEKINLPHVEPVANEDEDNWLERFRKAAQKNSPTASSDFDRKDEDRLKDSFFDNSNLDHFFNTKDSVTSVVTDSPNSFIKNEKVGIREIGNREYYYSSTLSGLKEIAQNIDKIAKKFDTDYAFTMNAGLSLHKPISPFTLIHAYVRDRDLELFEDYLNLTQVETAAEASVCLIIPEDSSLFEDSYELHGLYVVSNVQLRSDLIDQGLDKLAREI